MRPSDTRAGEALDLDALDDYLRGTRAGAELGEVRALRQFRGGYSNLTYLLTCARGEAVLRRPPFGPRRGSAHDVAREHGVLEGLGEVFGVGTVAPAPLSLCTDEAVLGAPFYLMRYVEGDILRAGVAEGLTPTRRARAAGRLVDTLARLHGADLGATSLATLGRPVGYVGRQVEGWARRYAAARTDDVPDATPLVEALRADAPPDAPGALLHNDFKFDNVVFAPGSDYGAVAAVLDWEMATVGDPLLDLGLALAYWTHPEEVAEMPFLGVNGTHLPGCPRREEVVLRYAAARGIDPPDVRWAFAFGNFKIAGILQQLYARYRAGHTADARFAPLGAVVTWLLRRGERAIRGGGR